MKLFSSRGRTIDCFLSIVTVLGGGASNDVKTPLLSPRRWISSWQLLASLGLTSDLILALK